MKLSNDKKILIVGLGLIGGSYAEGFTKKGYFVGAITRSQKSIDYALNKGIISEGTTEVTKEFVSKYDLVIFALYPEQFTNWIEKYQDCFKSGIVISDVTGVKCEIVYKIQSVLRKDVEFVPAHPMAGREVSGVENATSTIFNGSNYIVTPTSDNTKEAIEFVASIGEVLGFRKVSYLTPQEHDEMIGFLSQLTHCIAVSLMVCKESKHLVDFTGDSFRDLTRIAKINEKMWTELFIMNKHELLSQMDLFLGQFRRLRDALAQDDQETMQHMMRTSTERRKYFD